LRSILKVPPGYTFGINYGNMSYDTGSYNAVYGTYLFKNDSSGHSDSDILGHSESIPTKWDQWFHEKIVYNAQSGTLQYYVDGHLEISYSVGQIPQLDNYRFYIKTHPWGWYTGHYEYMDNFIAYTLPSNQPKAMPWIPLLLLTEPDSCRTATWVNRGTEIKALNVGSCGGQFKFVTLNCTPETVGTQVFIADEAIYPKDDPEHQGVSATISGNELTYTYQNGCINEHFENVTAAVYECQCQ
jgi:hypothetical protein